MTTTEFEQDNDTGTGRGGKVSAVRAKAGEKIDSARTRASEAFEAARERTSTAYGSARESASRARERTSQGIDSNPVGAIVGGLALGALIAAILPKSRREEEMLGDYGRRINDTAREAARAAREAGRSKLDEFGVNQDNAKQKLSDIASKAGEAARTSASAAARSVKSSPQSTS
jgi:ElaB/YqjD/DUF883 family membrane-anchored ribosome-binding protein